MNKASLNPWRASRIAKGRLSNVIAERMPYRSLMRANRGEVWGVKEQRGKGAEEKGQETRGEPSR